MGEWSNLTQREKSNIIRFAIKNGVSDINTIRDTFNIYAKDSLANVDYNMAAAKASGFGSNGNGHYPDTFKKPNHPTFSDESIYHSEATPGGRWIGNTYEPSDFVLNQQGGWNQFLRGFYNQEQGTGAVPVFNGGVMLPEVTVTPQYKEGGSIHIKHPGRLTALKERTGKTEAELWATGNAHTRKMITFARNARKWHKHDQESLESLSDPNSGYLNSGMRQFIPNDNIQNVQVWLNKGTRFQKKLSGTTNLQNIRDRLDSTGPDLQYIWDDKNQNSYSAFRRDPNYRAPSVPASKASIDSGIQVPSIRVPMNIGNKIKALYKNTAAVPKVSNIIKPLNDWIEDYIDTNGAYGATVLHSKSRPEYYAIKYWNVPGMINGGHGSSSVIDSIVPMLSIDEVNEALFDYKNRVGNTGFNIVQHTNSTGGPLYPFSFQKNPYWKTPVVRYDKGGILGHKFKYGTGEVDLEKWYSEGNNRGRGVNLSELKQFQDSLIVNNIPLTQRLALLATSAQETGSEGAASFGIGGMGLLGLSGQRMDSSLVSHNPKIVGDQIHFLIGDLKTTHPDNWLDGGTGGPKVLTGKDGFNQFWNGTNVDTVTQVLNKSYIRPVEREAAWKNRSNVATSMIPYVQK